VENHSGPDQAKLPFIHNPHNNNEIKRYVLLRKDQARLNEGGAP
jgi:hypothetical protein